MLLARKQFWAAKWQICKIRSGGRPKINVSESQYNTAMMHPSSLAQLPCDESSSIVLWTLRLGLSFSASDPSSVTWALREDKDDSTSVKDYFNEDCG